MSNFFASISHEMRTPLNGNYSILGAAMMDKKLSQHIKDKYISTPYYCATLQKYFINDLIDYITSNNDKSIALHLEEISI